MTGAGIPTDYEWPRHAGIRAKMVGMISTELAVALKEAGLIWHPQSGDRFQLDEPEFEADIFTVSEMTIEPRDYPTGRILAFNGTTEWALDSLRQDEAVWLPREDQMRELLGRTFRSLARATDGSYQVVAELPGRPERGFTADTAEDAYADALAALVLLAVDRSH